MLLCKKNAKEGVVMERLKQLRKEKGLTIIELGKHLQCSGASISHYEKGDREPSHETLMKYAEFFGVSIDFLLGRSEKRYILNTSLTEKESRLLGAFKGLIPPMQDYVLEMVEKLVEKNIDKVKKG